MSRSLVLLSLCAVGLGLAQWSEPESLAGPIQPFGAGPALVPARGDTVWALWVGEIGVPWLQARVFTRDTWRDTELVASGQHGVFWPAGIVDSSGHLVVAYYEGSYPIKGAALQDSWAIYTAVRTDTGWSRPEFTHGMMMEAFPYDIGLGRDSSGDLGMVWDQSGGGINSMDSVMFSRRTAFGWTERKCLAPGRYPDVNCSHGSLIPGDSTAFIIAYARSVHPDTAQVLVWDLDDSLLHTSTVFPGSRPMLARGQDVRFLVFTRRDSVFASENHGQGWLAPQVVATGAGRGGLGLCVDAPGWGWVCWPDSHHQALLASFNRGIGWSAPETVTVFSSLGAPRIASDDNGRLHCVWFDHESGTRGRLRHAHRLVRPGVTGRPPGTGSRRAPFPTIVRRALRLPAGADAVLLDATGRRVMELPGALASGASGAVRRHDIRHLAPGVYFVRGPGTENGGPGTTVHKVVVQR
jgi:hypothetical protein